MKERKMKHPINRFKASIFLLVLVFLAVGGLGAQTVKLGSPFPEGTEWDNTLRRLAAEWSDITNGRVRMRIYPGGVAGDDGDMVRKMRFNQLDAAVLTSFGMKSIVPDSFVMTIPGMLQSEDELDSVIREFAPRFDQDFIDEGFRVLSWSKTGWAYFFTDEDDPSVDAFKRRVLAVSSTDEELVMAFKAMGFKVVPMPMNELMVALQSGMSDTFYAPPMGAAVYQWFALAPNMINLPISPVVGGLVISERTWGRIPEEYHEDLKASVEAVVSEFFIESEKLNEQSLVVMDDNGLTVLNLTEVQKQDWYAELQDGVDIVVGDDSWISQRTFDAYVSHLEDLR